MEDKIKQVIIVRKDLKMSVGKISSQVAHASMKFLTDSLKSVMDYFGCGNLDCCGSSPTVFDYLSSVELDWIEGSFIKICVGIDSEEKLSSLCDLAEEAGIRVSRIVDNGATEFHGVPTFTCAALGPDYSSVLAPFTGDLKLL